MTSYYGSMFQTAQYNTIVEIQSTNILCWYVFVLYSGSFSLTGLALSSFYWGYAAGQMPAAFFVRQYGAKWVFGSSILLPSILCMFVPMAGEYKCCLMYTMSLIGNAAMLVGVPSYLIQAYHTSHNSIHDTVHQLTRHII